MKVISSLSEIKKPLKTSLAIGVFDGVHVGHMKILKLISRKARSLGVKSCVITFREHPDKHLNKQARLLQIKSLSAKLKRIEKCGIDITAALDFSEISGLTPDEFAEKVIAGKFGARFAASGRDFVFGKGASGNVRTLKKAGKKLGFETAVVEDVRIGGRRVSSTLIRKLLKTGRLKEAEKMLGRKYEIEGEVVHGRHIGFEFPTANLNLKYGDIPARGVWAVKVVNGKKEHLGAANIGFAPTLKNEETALLEVYILDFKGNLYGRTIRVIFLGRIRPERRFKSRQALLKRVEADIREIRKKYSKSFSR